MEKITIFDDDIEKHIKATRGDYSIINGVISVSMGDLVDAVQSIADEVYNEGYENGERIGYDEGLDHGETSGWEKGYIVGHDEGLRNKNDS